ncbi:MAG: glycosyltransferase [Ectothiorhodospiraceae bacterium]|nr:glycosyltransferase [Ectothiorhodospiraceae bacterium]
MRVLVLAGLYPNSEQPRHGIFVETRVRKLVEAGGVEVNVIAPVPWFPLEHARFGRYGRYARVPAVETRHGIEISHPRWLAVPKVGMAVAPLLNAASVLAAARRLRSRGFDFDVIDAHFFYPDGVAATIVGAVLGRPVVVTARGSDLNLFPRHAIPRRWIRWAARRAAAVITVSEALRQVLLEIGGDDVRSRTVRNGVDLGLFRPTDRSEARKTLGLDGAVVLAVGNLVPEKGNDVLVRALAQLPGVTLVLVGEGPQRQPLEALARTLGVEERVRFHENVPQPELASIYGAADVLALASEREGWPNVLLEAMACGCPVVAADVGGVREIVGDTVAGTVVQQRSAEAFASALRGVLECRPSADVVRAHAARYAWDEVSEAHRAELERAAGLRAVAVPGGSR